MKSKLANLALLSSLLLLAIAALALALNPINTQPPATPATDYDFTPKPQSPTYTLVDPGIYVGGCVAEPPPDARAVLCLSMLRDDYTTPIYQWQPIPDASPAPTLDWLRKQVTFIDTQRRAGNTVFIHCDAGISRSGMVSAAYFMWHNHWTRDQALTFLQKSRPIIFPNFAFMKLLQQWEETLPPGPATAADRN